MKKNHLHLQFHQACKEHKCTSSTTLVNSLGIVPDLHTLGVSDITKIKTTGIHYNGSTNGHILNKLDYFTLFQPSNIKVEQGTGSKEDNPQHTLSTQALKHYNEFKCVTTESLELLQILNRQTESKKIPTTETYRSSKLLDYAQLNIVKINTLKHSIPIGLIINKGIFPKLFQNLSYEMIHRWLSHISEDTIASMCKLQM
eukprot:73454-Ditylum_brightwellii.AAC.1